MENIRNFCIISHIDHGKSTLADRFLELTETIEARKMQEQALDSMDLERERGITIKMTPVTMIWRANHSEETRNKKQETRKSTYTLNLIDTPGHVDFSYEVSRALAAVEGAVLLVDGTKGVQAQTLAHLREAQKQNLAIIPAINKIDLESARPDEVEEEIRKLLPDVEKIFRISAKKGEGVEDLLQEVVRQVPEPTLPESSKKDGLPAQAGHTSYPRALIFDSHYDSYKGVLAYVRVTDGAFSAEDALHLIAQDESAEALEVGLFTPAPKKVKELTAGAIGYIATGIKEPGLVRVGDTIVSNSKFEIRNSKLKPLGGYEEPKPMVFASIFPSEGEDVSALEEAFSRLKLSDWALTYEPESSEVLGKGFRCGFLGSLHVEIVLERLEREFDLSYIATTPSVEYEVTTQDGETQRIYSPSAFPPQGKIEEIREPWVTLSLFTPAEYLGNVMQLAQNRRGVYKNTEYITPERVELTYEIPLAEIIVDFYDKLKSISSGFASVAYEPVEYRAGNLVRLDVLVAGDKVEALTSIVPRERAYKRGRKLTQRLKELLPKQLFAVPLQAAIGSDIVAREDLAAQRKDVTGDLYGGDVTRKKKLLEKQKKGKKRLKKEGRVDIPDRVFKEMLQNND